MNCLACEYDASWAALTTIARPMVGMAPRQRVNRPSSFSILSMDMNELKRLTRGGATFHQQSITANKLLRTEGHEEAGGGGHF